MKLEELIPNENDLLGLPADQLADRVLICLLQSGNSVPVRRRGLASRLTMGYPGNSGKAGVLAIEEAIMHLEHKMLIGIDPEEREFVFITREGEKQAHNAEKRHSANVVLA